MENTIQKEILIKASKEKVYEAIANPDLVVKWFPQAIEGDYKKGSQAIFSFGEHGKSEILVVDAIPHDYFSYRWVPGANRFVGDVTTVATTLVEFKLSEKDGETRVSVTETGFSSLPADIAEDSFKQNSGGWDFMLGRLETFFN